MSKLDKVKEFLVRIVKDDAFRSEIESQSTPEAQTELLEKSGYVFGQAELESATIKILELAEQGLFPELNETELAAVVGGSTGLGTISRPPIRFWPPTSHPPKVHPQPGPYYPWWHGPHISPRPKTQLPPGLTIGTNPGGVVTSYGSSVPSLSHDPGFMGSSSAAD
jgi:predicted ribosomally synthesized peptide with nif11-like leader